MIIRLTTEQVTKHWEAIREAVKTAIPDIPGQLANRDNNILRSLLIGESVCWVGYKKVAEKQNDIICILLTRIISDNITGIKSLLLYCLTGWDTMDIDFYGEGFETLKKYCKSAGCNRIVLYSNEPRILKVAEHFNYDTTMRFVTYQL